MSVRSIVLQASFVLVSVTGTVTLAWFSPHLTAALIGGNIAGQVCRLMGGKWESVRNECFTRACYAAGDCGTWLHPRKWCRDLKVGDSIGEVYFRLGNPSKVEGNTHTWLDGKPDAVAFTAVIENGVLISVNCL